MTDLAEKQMTPLDTAYAHWQNNLDDDQAQLGFYGRLAGAEIFLMLTQEAQGDQISPEVFDVGDAQFVLGFDTEERLAEFAGRIVPYVALTGRALAQMLAGQGTGVALNPEVAASSTLLPPEAMAWLAEAVDGAPQEAEATPEEILPPHGLPEALLTALDAQLAGTEGLAKMAYLAGVKYEGGAQSHLLGFIGTLEGAEPALARAVQEALTFSGLEAGAIDVAFFKATDAMAASLARHGLRFDLPVAPEPHVPGAPGMDPAKPPKLV